MISDGVEKGESEISAAGGEREIWPDDVQDSLGDSVEESAQNYSPFTSLTPSPNIRRWNRSAFKNNMMASTPSMFIEPLHCGYYELNTIGLENILMLGKKFMCQTKDKFLSYRMILVYKSRFG